MVRIRSGVDNAGGAPDEWNRVSLLPASRSRLLCPVCHHLRFSFFSSSSESESVAVVGWTGTHRSLFSQSHHPG